MLSHNTISATAISSSTGVYDFPVGDSVGLESSDIGSISISLSADDNLDSIDSTLLRVEIRFFIGESIIATESCLSGLIGYSTITDLLEALDTQLIGFGLNILDSVAVTELITGAYGKNVFESFLIFEQPIVGFGFSLSDSINLVDSQQVILCVVTKEILDIKESVPNTWKGVLTANSSFKIFDISSFGKVFKEVLGESVNLSDLPSYAFQLMVIDLLSCASSSEATALFYKQMSESLSMSDEAMRAWEKMVEETFNAICSSSSKLDHITTLAEVVALADSPAHLLFVNKNIAETLTVSPSISLGAVLSAALQEGIGLSTIIELDGEVWECWTLSTHRFHPSIYSNFDFNSYAVYADRAYGCRSDGIYELTGETDNEEDIGTGISIPGTSLGTTRKKRFRWATLGISGDSPAIKVENENDYAIYYLNANETSINRSLHGKKWTFSVMDFKKLDFIDLIPVVLTR